MELKEIQSLIKFVSESGVDEVVLEKKEFNLSIKTLQILYFLGMSIN